MNSANCQYVTKTQLVNIIISALIIVELVLTPGRWILFSLIDLPTYKNLPIYQQHLGVAFVNYWIPTALIYLSLVFSGIGSWLKSSQSAILPFVFANSVMIIFISLRAFPASLLGALTPFIAPIIVFPAILLIVYGFARLIWLNIRNRSSNSEKISIDHITLSVRDMVIVLIALVIPMLFGVCAGFNKTFPFRAVRTDAPIFDERCKGALEAVLIDRNDARSIFFAKNSRPLVSGQIRNGFYSSSLVSWPSNTILVNYDVDYVEIEHITSDPSAGQGKYIRLYGNLIKEYNNNFPVEEPDSDYALYSETLTNDADKALGIVGQTMKIIDLRTKEIVATSTYYIHTKQKRFCGHAPEGIFSQSEFIVRSLNLKPRVH